MIHNLIFKIIIAALSLGIFFSFSIESRAVTRPAEGTQGMVSSAHPIATEAGIATLKKGGNAFDAAVAVAATLNVVEPMMSGIGGYGTILVYDAKKRELWFLDSSGKIPVAVNSDVFRESFANYRENSRGAKECKGCY